MTIPFSLSLLVLAAAAGAAPSSGRRGTAAGRWPVPSALPPHGWGTVGERVFIHGCNSSGLLDPTALALAAKFPMMTIEKGQGEAEPGWAEDKIAAMAAQYHSVRPDGWTVFYMNAHFNWHMYRLSTLVEADPSLWVHNSSGQPCRQRGDPEFPQPADGMLLFNMSNPAMRALFVATAVNATRGVGRFNGIFVDSAESWRGAATLVQGAGSAEPRGVGRRTACAMSEAARAQLARGGEQLLVDLQTGVGSGRLVVAKDGGGGYNSSQFCNTEFLSDSFCSCYSCDVHSKDLADTCVTQMAAGMAAAARGQVVMYHGEVNSDPSAGTPAEQFAFPFAAFLIAASDASFFGFSDKWYFNGTTWHEEYDKPLGAPAGPAVQSAPGVWARSFAHAHVALDVFQHTSSVTFEEP